MTFKIIQNLHLVSNEYLYSFPRVAAINYHKCSGLKWQTCVFTVLEGRSLQTVGRATTPTKVLGKNLSLLLQFLVSPAVPWHMAI